MSGRSVLLVEDDLDIRALIEESLRRSEVVVTAVESGEAALAHLESNAVDLVILDIVLPGMDGWTVLGSLRNVPGLADLPVLVVSVLDAADRPLDAGVTYLAKPFRPTDLARAVRALLDPIPMEGTS